MDTARVADAPRWPVDGHDWAIAYLHKALIHGRTRHAYLITGPEGVGKRQLAHAFAQALNCQHEDVAQRPCLQCRSCKLMASGNHPDLIYAQNDPNSGQLKIDAIREVTRQIALKPFDSRYRVAIFQNFDAAQPRAQDALLKTLEEPSPHAVLLLTAATAEMLLPTITSRCQVLRLRPVAAETIAAVLRRKEAESETPLAVRDATLVARLSNGRIEWALRALHDADVLEERAQHIDILRNVIQGNRRRRFDIAEEISNAAKNNKPALRALLETWQTYWRDVLLAASNAEVPLTNIDMRDDLIGLANHVGVADALQAVRATRRMMQTLSTNAQVRMGLDVMLLDYPRLK
jgi:DNA polymerase III subunit delta'